MTDTQLNLTTNEILKKAQDIVNLRSNHSYVKLLDFKDDRVTIDDLCKTLEYAREIGVVDKEWITGTRIGNMLNCAINLGDKRASINATSEDLKEMQMFSHALNISEDIWINSVTLY